MTVSPKLPSPFDLPFGRPQGRLYPIVDVDMCRMRGLAPDDVVVQFLSGGATILQIRQKSGSSGSLLSVVRKAVAASTPANATVIVNDRADLAAMAPPAGVHLGQTDLPVTVVRTIVGGSVVCGLSTHTREQIDEAAALPVDYVAVGPIFRTGTKDTGYEPRGLDLVRQAAATGKPVVAIGGITLDKAASILEAGASAVAVISDLLTGGDPEARVREYLGALS